MVGRFSPSRLESGSLYNFGPSWPASREFSNLDLYEYQGKELLRNYGLETLPGIVAGTPEEAGRAAETLGGTVAVKAQVLIGGGGEAGGVRGVPNTPGAPEAAGRTPGTEIPGH